MNGAIIPYCGAAPLPGSASWNLDPVLVAVLLALAAAHYLRIRESDGWRIPAALAGWTVVALALISPLCNLSVALFSARVGQHMVIALVGAPLIALGLPRGPFAAGWTWPAVSAFGIALWLWHLPGPYELTFTSTTTYWFMHLSLFASALWLWSVLLGASGNLWTGLAASFFTAMQMSLLGALLTFSATPLFAVHLLTTSSWGLTPLDDQQLGGLIMWVPAGVLLVVFAVAAFGHELGQLERRQGAARS